MKKLKIKKDLLGGPFCFLLLLFTFMGCGNLFYFPSSTSFFSPERLGIKNYESVWLTSKAENRAKLHGWQFYSKVEKDPKKKNLILFFHGNAQNISSHFLNLAWLLDHPNDFYIFDYQGYGLSEGAPSQNVVYKDGIAALEYAVKKFKTDGYQSLIVFAQSLGGIIASKSLIEFEDSHLIDLVVLDSTFSSYKNIGFKKLTQNWITLPFSPLSYLLLSDKTASKGKFNLIKSKRFLVIHGTEDQIVPIGLGKNIYSELKSVGKESEFWEIKGGRHTDVFMSWGNTYRERFLNLISVKTP